MEQNNDILKKVRKIEIKARGLSRQLFSGEYHSAFKGRGMAFSEVREYQYGDDIRSIDWNVTARLHHPYVKIFEEEREMTVMLLVDVSGSNRFGTHHQFKEELVAEVAATLAFSAIQNNDKVGVILFSDRIEKFIPPKKGSSHILRIIRELITFRPESNGTDLAQALGYFSNVIKKRCTAFLLSDFYDDGYTDALKIASNKHDLVAIRIADEKEEHLPDLRPCQQSGGIAPQIRYRQNHPLHRRGLRQRAKETIRTPFKTRKQIIKEHHPYAHLKNDRLKHV